MKRKIYIARRIAHDPTGEMVVNINDSTEIEKIGSLYAQKEIERDTFIHNGHWILMPVDEHGTITKTNLPTSLTHCDVLEMVKSKIDSSEALIAVLGAKSFGAIVELGYAVGRGNIAVYVLPESGLVQKELKDLWLSFQFALQTKHLWKEDDIMAVKEFGVHNIKNLEDYENFILSVIPFFLERTKN